ncbi:MAG: putative metal cation transporter [Solirubrobacteraceae bacterium]|nr:putative metal cation transporter [Solirubrobacteraceae bacterium]
MARRRRRRIAAVTGSALAAATAAGVIAIAGHHAGPSELLVQRAVLTPGSIGLIVTNGSDQPARLAQVQIDRGFVHFAGPAGAVAPHATVRLTIPYPWVPGEGYDVKVLTGAGATLDYRVAPQV